MISTLRQALFIARTDIRSLLRQKETQLWTFVMPIVFFYFIGTITGGGGMTAQGPASLVLRSPDNAGFLADVLQQRLTDQGFAVERKAEVEGEPTPLRVLTIPATGDGLTQAVLADESVTVTFARRSAGLSASYDEVRLARAVYGLSADLSVLEREGREPSPESLSSMRDRERSIALDVRPAGALPHIPTGYEQAIPGTMVMFTMMILLTGGAVTLVLERRDGLLRRLASTPIPRSAVVLGKWGSRMALGMIQVGFGMVVGTLLFGMRWGDAVPAVGLVLFSWAAFNASVAMLAANVARSHGQIIGIGVLTTMVLAALGGCWWPIEITPGWMQSLSLFLPTGWVMDALHRLVSFGQPARNVVPHVSGLLASAAIIGAAATRRFRYQ